MSDCENSPHRTDVRGFSFTRCEDMGVIVTCFEKGIACNKLQITSNTQKFWQVYSITAKQGIEFITTKNITTRSTPGEFTATM